METGLRNHFKSICCDEVVVYNLDVTSRISTMWGDEFGVTDAESLANILWEMDDFEGNKPVVSEFSLVGGRLKAFVTGAKKLNLDNKGIINVDALPDSLEFIRLDGVFNDGEYDNDIATLPTLPTGLKYFTAKFNDLTSLPAIPNSVYYLNVANNQITEIPNMPTGITAFYGFSNQLTALPNFPEGVIGIDVQNNLITNLPSLPSTLEFLSVQNNELTSLPTLPNGLKQLAAHLNKLTSLPSLPSSLTHFFVFRNDLTTAVLDVAGTEFVVGTPPNKIYFHCQDQTTGQTVSPPIQALLLANVDDVNY